ncbi:MAG: hypothetical protein R6X16_10940 [Anaerolineae bacterium]
MNEKSELHSRTAPNLAIPSRSKQAIPDLIDLGGVYTQGLEEDGFGAPGLNLGAIARGVRAYAHSAFDIRGVVRLAGGPGDTVPGGCHPVSVNIPVGLKGRRLHVLQGAVGSVDVDTVIGSYTLNYAGGHTRRFPVIYGRHVRDLSDAAQSPLTDAEAIVLDAGESGQRVQLARYVANNPLPDVTITSIDLNSELAGSAPFLVAVTLERNNPTYEWFDSVSIYNHIIPRSPAATSDQVDLSEYYSASLDDDWFHHSGHDLHDVPRGLQKFGGVTFDVRGLIVLGSNHSLEITGLALPEELIGIPVNRKGRAIHFLHACAFDSPPGTRIGEYRVHYANGMIKSADIVYSRNVMDWWVNPGHGKVTDAEEAWFGSNAATREIGRQTRLIKYSWQNPLPDVEITTIDFVSALEAAAPMVMAITVEPS